MSDRVNFDQRVLILGWDGATWDLLKPWVDAGDLPVLAGLMRDGAWGPMRTVIPPGTGPAWSSMVTGKNPGKHGVFEFMERRRGSYRIGPLDGTALRAETIWDRVGNQGGEVVLLNIPMTYPPRQVAGTLISGILTPRSAGSFTYPADFRETLLAREPGYAVMPTEVYAPGRAADFLADLRQTFEHKRRVLLWLMAEKPWRFLMQVFNETDILQHALWHLADPQHPNHDPREASHLGDVLLEFYRSLDETLGEVLDRMPENSTLALVSDHGAGPLYRFLHTNLWLIEHGFLRIRKHAVSRFKHWLFRRGFTPMNLYNRTARAGLGRVKTKLRWTAGGYAFLRSGFLSFGDVDWDRTVAYGLGGGVVGGIYINLEGREPAGKVRTGGDYERVREEIADALRSSTDPESNGPLVDKVWFREDLFAGPFTAEAPDLYYAPADERCAVFGDFEFSSNRVLEPTSPAISCQHRMEGVLAVRGPGVEAGKRLDGVHITDVAPTVLHLMGMPVPSDMDGNVLTVALGSEFLRQRPVRTTRGGGTNATGGDRSYDDQQEGEIIDRLKGLGYIS
ncbi:MAG: alkaline phosphatase family protein [Candidatus Eisenbacteria sp.]|nr:alkaline phosphatase family protein [Candidatus Eisenbacteria bacterium]